MKAGTTSRRFPPVLILGLTVMWLVMNQTLAPGQILLGALLATGVAWTISRLRPLQPNLSKVYLGLVVLARVFVDIVRSNVAVARIVLGLIGEHKVRSGFLKVPLDMRDPHALAALSTIITATPGTVWVDLSPDGSILTLHMLDMRDEEQWIHRLKEVYEKPLMEIFE